MKHTFQILIFLAATLLQATGFTATAQDVTFNLIAPSPQTTGGVTVKYNYYAEGANIYSSGGINNELEISSSQSIACIKFTGVPKKTGKVIAKDANGTLKFRLNGTSMWEGSSNHIVFAGEDETAEFCISEIRIWYVGSTYEPEPDDGGDDDNLIGTPLVRTSSVPVDGKAVKMAIISATQFESLVEEYALWKTQQGYEVEEVYVENYSNKGALTGEDLARSIQNHLKTTRPAFVLIMGDEDVVPPFTGTKTYHSTAGDTDYITDYFYGEYTGDYFPEAYVGRFSGTTEDDIRAQMNKTKFMALLSSTSGEWLGNSLCILSDDPTDTTIKSGHEYAVDYLGNKLDSKVTDCTLNPATINNTINAGCGIVTYYGHGSSNSFNSGYTIYHASNLSNENKYPVLLAMTCLTGEFDKYSCLAEEMQRMPKAGTVAYVGATRESYLDKQFLAGGLKDGQTYLGFMRSMFPTTDKDPLNQHARTLGEGVAIARYGLLCYSKEYMEMGTEYHELFGDPTYQPYYTTPLTMKVTAPASAVAGHIINVKAAPKTVVCISAGRYIAAVGLTDDEGNVALKLATAATAGAYTLYCSAPNYTDYQTSITLAAYDGQEDIVDDDGDASDFNFNDFTRHKVLIEKFTGQNCQYCAPADSNVEKYLTDKDYKDKVVELRHYSYGGDGVGGRYLKIPGFHDTLASTWEISGHPNYMVDRSNNDSYGYMNNGYQIGAEAMANGDYVGYRLRQPCFVSLSLDGSTYDADTRTLKVVVSGKAAKDLPDLRVNVFVTQSGIEAPQSGQGNYYIHDGVTRAFLTTGPNGDELDLREDSAFQMTYTYTIPESYYNFAADINNMAVVAFVNSWDNYGYNHATEGQKCFENSMVYNTLDINIAALPLKAQIPALPGGDTSVVPPTEPKEISFVDGTAYNATTAVHYDKVTYTRDFKNTNWQALYVPFSINYEEWNTDYEIARIYNFIDYDDNNDGVFDRTYLVIQKKTSGSTEPNTPYLIRAKETGLHSLVLTDRKLERAQQSSIDCGSVDYDYTFYGTYTGVSDMYANGYYALSGGALNKANSASVTLGAQRWYMQVTPRTGSYPTKAQSIQILVDGEYATEDIEALTASPKNESPVAYDLMGRNVKGSVKGISIVNSKKIIK